MAETQLAPALPSLVGGAAWWCSGDEALRLTSFNADADAQVTLTGRFLEADRLTPVPLERRHVPNTDRTAATVDIALARGWLQQLTVRATTGSPTYAHTFVIVELIRGLGTSATVLATLLAGPVSANTRRAWPGSPLASSIEGPGALRSITGTDPAANVEISETVPTGARWKLHAIALTLVTDATAADREVILTFDDGTTVYYAAAPAANQAASLTRRYSAGRGGVRGISLAGLEIAIALPDLWLPAGHRIRTATTGRQATDNFGAPQLLVEEHLEAA